MKCFTIFGACLLIAAVAKIYSQNVDGDPVKELDKIIAEKDFTIKIFRMISNPYNVKALDKGKGFIELTGYRLAEVLHILSKESKIIVQVKSIQKNPVTAFRIEFAADITENIWQKVFKTLADEYKFLITESNDFVIQKQMIIDNINMLASHKTKSLEKGIRRSSNISKSGRVELKGYTLYDLAEWLTYAKNYFVSTEGLDQSVRYDFDFLSLSDLEIELEKKYGIKFQSIKKQQKVYIIGN